MKSEEWPEPFGDPDHCNLCRARAGLPPLYVVPPADTDTEPKKK